MPNPLFPTYTVTKITDSTKLTGVTGLNSAQLLILTSKNPYSKTITFENVYAGSYSIELTYAIAMSSDKTNIHSVEITLTGFDTATKEYLLAADNFKSTSASKSPNRGLITGLEKKSSGEIQIEVKIKTGSALSATSDAYEYFTNLDVDKTTKMGIWLIPVST